MHANSKEFDKLREKFPFLRQQIRGRQSAWSTDEIKDGFSCYYYLYNRYPTVHEIDYFPYLPSSRSIMKGNGGLPMLREKLGLAITHYAKGNEAGQMRRKSWEENKNVEEDLYDFLKSKISEVRIHEEKPIIKRPYVVRADFFIYTTKNTGIAIDVFKTEHIRSFNTHLHIKTKKYLNSPVKVYYVLYSKSITDNDINRVLINKKYPLPAHIKVITEKKFKLSLRKIIKENKMGRVTPGKIRIL